MSDKRTYEAELLDLDRDLRARSFDAEYLSAHDLLNLPTPKHIIEDVIFESTYGILAGRDQTFKSFVAIDWALSIAVGAPWCNKIVDQGNVLYCAGEGVFGLNNRVAAWSLAREEIMGTRTDLSRFFARRSAVNLYKNNSEAFDDLLKRAPNYKFIVLDTLRRHSGGADGNSSQMGVVVDHIEMIKTAMAPGGAVMVIAHTDKGNNDTRGFSGIEDDADIIWRTNREENARKVTLSCTKMKDAANTSDITLVARASHGSMILEPLSQAKSSDAEAADATAKQLVMLIMRTHFAETGTSMAELLRLVDGKKSEPSIYRARAELIKEGLISLDKKGSRVRIELGAGRPLS